MSRKYLGILGYPLGHTLSPIFQQAALDHLGLDIRYEVWETPPERLPEALAGLRGEDRLGANVTIPHKEAVMTLLDDVDEAAQRIGAVNTIVNRDGALHGYNTDYEGFLRGLQEVGYDPAGKLALVLGAGGAARAVCCALLDRDIHSLIIVNRTRGRAEALVQGLIKMYPSAAVKVAASPWAPELIETLLEAPHLVVNSTSIGMKGGPTEGRSPLEGIRIPKETVVYDLVYNPPETPLLRQAVEAGAQAIAGLPMLIYQGAAAFQMWTGREAPVEVMFKAAMEALKR